MNRQQADDTIVSTRRIELVQSVPTQVVGADPKRVSLALLCQTSVSQFSPNPGILQLGGPSNSAQGIEPAASIPFVLSRELHGAMCTCSWWVLNLNSSDIILAIECVEK